MIYALITVILSKDEVLILDKKQQIKKKIQQTELQIKRLNAHSSNSEVCEDLYNSLILQKAVLKKEFEELEKNTVLEAIKKIIPRREKRICDYFATKA